MKHKFYSPEMEYRKDNTPSTSVFVWVVPAMVVLALLCKQPPAEAPRNSVCVLGVCL